MFRCFRLNHSKCVIVKQIRRAFPSHTPWCTSMRVACSTQAPTACTDTSQVHTCAVAWHVQLFEALWSGYRKERQKLETSLKALHVAHGGAHVDRPHNISVAHLVHIMSEPPNPQNTMEPKSKFVTRRSMSTLVFLKNWSSRTTTSSACPSLGSGCRSTKLHAHIYIYAGAGRVGPKGPFDGPQCGAWPCLLTG